MKEWIVNKSEAGGRLDKYLKARLKEAPDSFFYKMARKKNLMLNDLKCTGKEILKEGDRIKLYVSDDTISLFSSGGVPDLKLSSYKEAFQKLGDVKVLKETEDLLFLYKPSGVLSQKADEKDLSLNDWLIGYLLNCGKTDEERLGTFRPSVLNRLDRNTAGIVICGITPAGSRFGSSLLKDRSLHKYYHALVEGKCGLCGDYNGYLWKNEKENKAFFYHKEEDIPADRKKDAKPVSIGIKSVRSIKDYPLDDKLKADCTVLEIELYTGKSHQIRVMLSALGYPIVGDPKYGKNTDRDGQKLCAVRLEFPKTEGDFAYLSGLVISCDAGF